MCVNVRCMVQKLAKHAEPAAQELSDKMEGGAEKFAKHAGPAARELSERAVDAAKDVEKHAAPKAHKVWSLPHISLPILIRGLQAIFISMLFFPVVGIVHIATLVCRIRSIDAHRSKALQDRAMTNCAKYTLGMQLADLMDDQAQEISEKTPKMTENLQQKAEEQAGKVSEKAKPAADQASSAIEGSAKRVAEGGLHSSTCALQCILSMYPSILPSKYPLSIIDNLDRE